MKQTNTFIVLRNKQGKFLMEYKNNDRILAYSAGWTYELGCAAMIDECYFNHDRNKDKYEKMAVLFDAELIKVQAEYTLTTLDGQEPAEAEEENSLVKAFLKSLMSED